MTRFALLILICALLFKEVGTAYAGGMGGGSPVPNAGDVASEAETFSTDKMLRYEGAVIANIRVVGLVRTSEHAVRWLMGGKEGEAFSVAKWVYGLKKLYNTHVLYDLQTSFFETSPGVIEITLSLHDKWTLFPYALVQGGGGSSAWQAGLFDDNVGGYFTNASISAGAFNNSFAYDVNLFQEFFLDTEFMGGLDVSLVGNPVVFQNVSGAVTQSFTWARNQQQLLLGRRYGEQVRAFSFFEIFQDTITTQDPVNPAQVYTQNQYRIRPTVIVGRSNLTNYLEEGHELTFAPTSANFFSSQYSYSQIVMDYKLTHILPHNANFGMYLSVGMMTPAPSAYLFRMGGYDSVRGFTTNRMIGPMYFNSNLEYRPTLFTYRFKWDLIDLVALQGCLFTDSALIGSLPMVSAGAGVRLIFVKYSNAILRLDFGQTITPAEGYDISFGVGQFF